VSRSEEGFTIIEVLVAVMILGVGVMALAGSSAVVTRMIGRGKSSGRSAQVALSRFETLRQAARSTATRCTAVNFVSGSQTTAGLSERWIVGATGDPRPVKVIVTVPRSGGAHPDTFDTRISCT
jgi:prepilin-type N-terminal cleavage/methylation domain-containing protein